MELSVWVTMIAVCLSIFSLFVCLCIWAIKGCYYVYGLIYPQSYEKYNILELNLIYNRGKVYRNAIFAGLLSLYNKGLITISLHPKHWTDVRKLRFTLTEQFEYTELSEDEQYLVDWLFQHKEGYQFRLNTIAGPLPNETEDIERLQFYRERLWQLNEDLAEWKEVLQNTWNLKKLQEKMWIRKLFVLLGGLTITMICILLFLGELEEIWLVSPIIVVGFGWLLIFLYVTDWSRNALLIYAGCMCAVCIIYGIVQNPNVLLIIIAIFCCLLPVYVLPFSRKQLRYSQVRWFKRHLMRGKYQYVDDPQRLEYLIQASIVLQCGEVFMDRHQEWIEWQTDEHEENHTFLMHAWQMVEAEAAIFDLYPVVARWRGRYEVVHSEDGEDCVAYYYDDYYSSDYYDASDPASGDSDYYSSDSSSDSSSNDSSSDSSSSSSDSSDSSSSSSSSSSD
ncbi:DUF2207 family protein [Paenibacillus bovis]|uniref:Predicted membrane protein YciQ-like C-terminal domain-containing protein n=1 Tax=Paenibacillus bovis TaxID=1616788 RepID=A0A172ZCG5_9BACL|nr:DUF2207 domain-containing protein [Paenibacillus bovis]ANF95308.1 hypothetical protein AR543_04280 [Paenibacillus bovis]